MTERTYRVCCYIVFEEYRICSVVIGIIFIFAGGCVAGTKPDATIEALSAALTFLGVGCGAITVVAHSQIQMRYIYTDHDNWIACHVLATESYAIVFGTLASAVAKYDLRFELPVWILLLALGGHYIIPEVYFVVGMVGLAIGLGGLAAACGAIFLPFYLIKKAAEGLQHLCTHGCPIKRVKVAPTEPEPDLQPEPTPIPEHRRPEFTPIPPYAPLEHTAAAPEPSAPPPSPLPPPRPDPPAYDIEAPPPPDLRPLQL